MSDHILAPFVYDNQTIVNDGLPYHQIIFDAPRVTFASLVYARVNYERQHTPHVKYYDITINRVVSKCVRGGRLLSIVVSRPVGLLRQLMTSTTQFANLGEQYITVIYARSRLWMFIRNKPRFVQRLAPAVVHPWYDPTIQFKIRFYPHQQKQIVAYQPNGNAIITGEFSGENGFDIKTLWLINPRFQLIVAYSIFSFVAHDTLTNTNLVVHYGDVDRIQSYDYPHFIDEEGVHIIRNGYEMVLDQTDISMHISLDDIGATQVPI